MTGLEMDDISENVRDRVDSLTNEIEEIQHNAIEVLSNIEENGGTWSRGDSENLAHSVEVAGEYERWYNSALPLISEYLSDRENDFRKRYERIRGALTVDIEYIRREDVSSPGRLQSNAMNALVFQRQLVDSIPPRVESEMLKAKRRVSTDITSNEVQKAKELFDDGNIRAAGVVAGVALERDLLSRCESSEQHLDYGYMDGITSLAKTLSNADEISNDDERLLEHLAGIRNKCSHASEEEPGKREVERLLNEAEDFIRRRNS